ncbi:hypothetical protein [Kribbella sp.]|uniref:hypothetical protein n=1 Tax=Kribbella sp. TaxID=1871183 RepID=UPI002D6DCEC8|nr:hypothetical protein [Kribbella sp.]HZX07200.1 hypothetical protein [Kribbella sp.]
MAAPPTVAMTARFAPDTARRINRFAEQVGLTPAAALTVLASFALDHDVEPFLAYRDERMRAMNGRTR